ncbi:MAG: DUF192 domain-containing protein [Rhodothalassiaceae bacterium]
MIRLLVLVALLCLPAPALTQPGNSRWHQQTATPQSLPLEPLVIDSGDQRHRFQVEVARTRGQRTIGLMFRDHLPADRGMLFDNGRVMPTSFWMRNTYIPLDMVFVHADGRIESIAKETTPLSDRPVHSGAPVRAVLELQGGLADTLGLQPGDLVRHEMFGNLDRE